MDREIEKKQELLYQAPLEYQSALPVLLQHCFYLPILSSTGQEYLTSAPR
jgi:hypothetical protein